MMNNLIPDIIKAIKKINEEKAYLKDELDKASTKDEVNDVKKQLNDLTFNAQNIILDAMRTIDLNALFKDDVIKYLDSIPKPKDGEDGKDGLDAVVDYESLNKYLNNKVADIKLPEAEKVDYNLVKKTIKELVNQFTSTIRNGIDGKDGLDGSDGIGIKEIKDNKSYFEIILDNGNKKKILKPLDIVKPALSGGINLKTINGELIVGNGNIIIGGGSGGSGDMLKSTYDTNNNGVVDNAEKVNNLTVETAVPLDAVFTDTIYDDTALSDRVTDLEDAGFITSYTVTQLDVTQYESFITITESQISDLRNYSLVGHNHSISDITGLSTALSNKIETSLIGQPNGLATLDSAGLIPTTQLPSFVDDVLEYANLASFPATGTTGKIYVALDTNKTYRWSGSVYVYITSGAVDSVNGQTGIVNIVNISGNAGTVTNGLYIADIGVTVQAYNVDTVIDASYVHTDNNFTNTLRTKLDGIAAGAEVNVNPDWNATTGDAQILNKPTTLSGYGITDVYSKSEIDIIVGDINSALDTINGEII